MEETTDKCEMTRRIERLVVLRRMLIRDMTEAQWTEENAIRNWVQTLGREREESVVCYLSRRHHEED